VTVMCQRAPSAAGFHCLLALPANCSKHPFTYCLSGNYRCNTSHLFRQQAPNLLEAFPHTEVHRCGAEPFSSHVLSPSSQHGVLHASLFAFQGHLRAQLFDQLRRVAGPDVLKAGAAAAGTGAPGACIDQGTASHHGASSGTGLWHAALNSLFAGYLAAAGCQYTLSVFKAETEQPEKPALSQVTPPPDVQHWPLFIYCRVAQGGLPCLLNMQCSAVLMFPVCIYCDMSSVT